MALDNIKTYMVGIILGIVIIMSGVFMIGSLYSADTSLDAAGDIARFNDTLALSTEINSSVNSMTESINIDSEKVGALGWINALFGSAFEGLRTLKSTMSFVAVAGTESAGIFGITELNPIISVIMLVISIIILIAIYEAITRQ